MPRNFTAILKIFLEIAVFFWGKLWIFYLGPFWAVQFFMQLLRLVKISI